MNDFYSNKYDLIFYTIIFLLTITICYLNYSLKLSGDELSYYKLAVTSNDNIIERSWHLPGFHYFLRILNIFSLIDFFYFRIFITIINFLLIGAIVYFVSHYFNVNKFIFSILLLISPTFTLYFISSLWADTFSSLLFTLAILLIFIYFNNDKKKYFLFGSIILFMSCTLLRPQYTLFVLLISLIYLSKLSSLNIKKKDLLKRFFIFILFNILIFIPLLAVTFNNYFNYDIFLPFISPAIVKLFHFPNTDFIDIIQTQFGSLNLFGIHIFIENYSSENNISFGEAARYLNGVYTSEINYINWVTSNSIEALKAYYWTGKHIFLDRYIHLTCWGQADCFQRNNMQFLYAVETFSRIQYIAMLVYIVGSAFMKRNNLSKYIKFIMVLIIFSYIYILCFNGIGLPHGRHFFEFQALIVTFFCLSISYKKKESLNRN